MNQLDEMVETNEELQEENCRLEDAKQSIQSLYDSEKGDLQSEIESLLAEESDKLVSVTTELDAMILTNEKLQQKISMLEEQKQLCQDTFGNEKVELQSKIDSLKNDLIAAQDELCQTRANADRMKQERDANVETAFHDLDDMKLKNELLLDEVSSLKCDLQACHNSLDTERGRYESKIASLSSELKSSSERFEIEKESFRAEWRHFQLLLKHLVDSIEGEGNTNELNASSDSEELPDIASQLGTLIKLVGKKEESILQLKSQIESLEFDLRDARIVRDRLIRHDQMEEDLETSRFLSEIEEAKVKVIGMDRRLVSERSKRKELETKLSNEGKNQEMIKEELSEKERIIDELEETVQLKIVEIEKLESQLRNNNDMREKLEGKYEETQSQLETYHSITTELKQTIIEKVSDFGKLCTYMFSNQVKGGILTCIVFHALKQNHDIESKESKIMELQFQVDDLASQVEGWKASLQGLTSEADVWKNELQNLKHDIQEDGDTNDTSDILSTSSDRHDELSNEIAKLEEKMLVMNEDHRQQSSMHKSIVDGLEAKCNMLSEENTEAQSYISSLEDSKSRLESKIGSLKNECDVQCRRLSELESIFDIMKQQKSVSETLCDEVLSGLRKLTEVAIMYSSRLDGFSEEMSSPSSWSINLEYISRVIECALKLNQKYLLDIQGLEATLALRQNGGVPVVAEAITTKAKGSGVWSQESAIMPEHLDMINEIKSMKNVLKNVMASPKLTPVKAKQRTSTDEDGDLYSDLLMAYDQLENLSKNIETYQEEQLQWKEKESTLQSRIKQLEEDKLQLESSSKEVDQPIADSDKKSEASAVMMHLDIVKGMARELNNTREKVQMLKSALDKEAR
jgi:chromosome segregation ATPase